MAQSSTVKALVRAIKAEPIVGVKAASEIIGIKHPNFPRYRDRLTEIPVQGGASMFPVSEVQAIADERAAQLAEKARQAAEAEASA